MNPAALKTNLEDLKQGGILIVDQEGFNEQNLKRAGYERSPLADGSLKGKYQVFPLDVAKLTQLALKDMALSAREVFRCRNFLCLGIVSWLYHRPLEPAEAFIKDRFKKNPQFVEANTRVLHAGFNFAETTELFAVSYEVSRRRSRRATTGTSPATRQPRSASSPPRTRRADRSSSELSHHAGERRAARALGAEAVRRLHLPGRGRDRRHRRRARRGVRRRDRDHHDQRARV
jgi:hypothetical protein